MINFLSSSLISTQMSVSEFINKTAAKLLNKLLINQTKSRSRHCNDNALIESKNGSVLRKNMGYFHAKGRERKIYGQYTTPHEKLKEVSLALKKNFLIPGQTFAKLDIMAYKESDNESAKTMRQKQSELFRKKYVIRTFIVGRLASIWF